MHGRVWSSRLLGNTVSYVELGRGADAPNPLGNQVSPPVPYELLRGIENMFLDRRPYEGSAQMYTLERRAANEIRSRLFAMVSNDTDRRRSAWSLLGQIEFWRYGMGDPAASRAIVR